MGAQHQEYALCWTAHPQVAWLGYLIIVKWVAGFSLGTCTCAACGSTPRCQVQHLCTGLLPPSRICHSQHFGTQSRELKFGAQCLCTRYPMRKRNKTKHQGRDKKKVRVYYPDSIFIFWQLLMVITPGNQKNEGQYMRRDFRDRRLKTKVEAAQHLMIG